MEFFLSNLMHIKFDTIVNFERYIDIYIPVLCVKANNQYTVRSHSNNGESYLFIRNTGFSTTTYIYKIQFRTPVFMFTNTVTRVATFREAK